MSYIGLAAARQDESPELITGWSVFIIGLYAGPSAGIAVSMIKSEYGPVIRHRRASLLLID